MGGIGISIYGIFLSFLFAFWVMTPAYVPNSAAAVFGGGDPLTEAEPGVTEDECWGMARRGEGLLAVCWLVS